jgi:hypothetical protein
MLNFACVVDEQASVDLFSLCFNFDVLFDCLKIRLRAENTAREATQRCNELKDKLMLQHTVQRLDLTKQHLVSVCH